MMGVIEGWCKGCQVYGGIFLGSVQDLGSVL